MELEYGLNLIQNLNFNLWPKILIEFNLISLKSKFMNQIHILK
jgi:hypothetical protein